MVIVQTLYNEIFIYVARTVIGNNPTSNDDIVGRIDRIDCKQALFRIKIFDKVFNSYRLGPSLIAAFGNRSKIFGNGIEFFSHAVNSIRAANTTPIYFNCLIL